MSQIVRFCEIVLFGFLFGVCVSSCVCRQRNVVTEVELQDEIVAPYETVKYDIQGSKTQYAFKVFGGDVEKFDTKDSVSLIFKKPGEYHVVLTTITRKGVKLSYGKVLVGGSDSPSVDNSLRDRVHNAVLQSIPKEYHSICKAVAANYRAVAGRSYASEEEMLTALKSGNRDAIRFDGGDMRKEAVFTEFLRSGGTLDLILLDIYPNGVGSWGPVLLEIADGLEQ